MNENEQVIMQEIPQTNEKTIKNVDRKQCVGILISSIVALCIFLIPMTFGSAGLAPTYKFLPIIGNGSIFATQEIMCVNFVELVGLSEDFIPIIAMIMEYGLYAFVGILAFNIFFSLILIISGSQILRLICKTISSFAGVAMIVISLSCLVYIAGFAGKFIMNAGAIETIMIVLEASGLLFILGMLIFSIRHSIKQFKWYSRLY